MLTTKYNFSDILLVPKKSSLNSRSCVNLKRKFHFKNSKKTWEGIPIVASNMDTIGTRHMYKPLETKNMITAFNKHLTKFPNVMKPSNFMYSAGMEIRSADSYKKYKRFQSVNGMPVHWLSSEDDDINLKAKLFKNIDLLEPEFVCFDIANGYINKYHSVLKEFKKLYPHITVCAGNVVTPELVEFYIQECGVDIVKIGIGSGSVCTTRNKTGVGYPQFSCIIECATVAHSNGGYIMSDGGIKTPGDVAKAFAAGSDFVMLGGILAGHSESGTDGGSVIVKNGKKYVKFYGMSSEIANDKYSDGTKGYRTAEGKEILVEYKGPVENTLNDILGGLRSTCTYLNSENLEDLPKNAEFIVGQ
jgi:GMP reductase